MSTYVVTGSASGMGKATAERLRADGHTVIGVDQRDAEVVADLSTPEGRNLAVEKVLEASGGSLDGAVLAAGLGGVPGRSRLILEVNYFGVVDLLTGLHDALVKHGGAKVVVIGSNSTIAVPMIPERLSRALLRGDTDAALRTIAIFGKNKHQFAYAGSKTALARWVRRHAVGPEWAGSGVNINIVAPGAVYTPLLKEQIDAGQGDAIESFPVPVEVWGTADQIAVWNVFLLSDAADYVCGTSIYVDGGTEAWLKPDSWPRNTGLGSLVSYLRRAKAWKDSGRRAVAPKE